MEISVLHGWSDKIIYIKDKIYNLYMVGLIKYSILKRRFIINTWLV